MSDHATASQTSQFGCTFFSCCCAWIIVCVAMHRMSCVCVPAFGDLCLQPLSFRPCRAFVVVVTKFPQVVVLPFVISGSCRCHHCSHGCNVLSLDCSSLDLVSWGAKCFNMWLSYAGTPMVGTDGDMIGGSMKQSEKGRTKHLYNNHAV